VTEDLNSGVPEEQIPLVAGLEPGTSTLPPQRFSYRGIPADVIVYIFAHLHRGLRTEGNMLDIK